jgi:electron transport complex protein RnfE
MTTTTLPGGDTRGTSSLARVPWLGLCPLLAASTSLTKGFGLGLATLLVLAWGRVIAATVGRRLPDDVRLGVMALLMAAFALVVERGMAAWLPDLHSELGIFLSLTAASSILLVAADAVPAEQSPHRSLANALTTGISFLGVMLLLGALRDLLGHRTQLLLLPAGAFMLIGSLLAARNAWRARAAASGPGDARGSTP